MRLPVELRHVAPRLATGAFILNPGLSKRGIDEETAAQLHGMAKNTCPVLERMRPATFVRLLGLYLRTPGMRQEGSPRSTQEGTALAEDAWMLGIGLGFVVDEMTRDTP